MSQRTTVARVKAYLTLDYDSTNNPSLAPFIASAVSMTDDAVACAARKGVDLNALVTTVEPVSETVTKATIIETYLACHFYKFARDKQSSSQSAAGRSVVYAGQDAMKEGTTYKASAIALDISGCLASFFKSNRARAAWLGRRPSAQTPYVMRN